jgi:hypothetical protein
MKLRKASETNTTAKPITLPTGSLRTVLAIFTCRCEPFGRYRPVNAQGLSDGGTGDIPERWRTTVCPCLGGGKAEYGLHVGPDWLLIGAIGHAIDIILDRGHDAEPSAAQAMADLAADEDLRSEAATRRSEKLLAIGSEATFFSGLARIDGEFRSIRVAVTPHDFVLFDNWAHLDPVTELARLPRDSIIDAVVDETGNEVADQLLDPIRELETPEEERYQVVLKRRDASGALQTISFLFRSGEPALACRDQYRGFIGPRG